MVEDSKNLLGVKLIPEFYSKACLTPQGMHLPSREIGDESPASAEDGVHIYNRMFAQYVHASDLKKGTLEYTLFEIVSHLLRFNPRERWTASRVLQELSTFAKTVIPSLHLECNLGSVVPPPPPPALSVPPTQVEPAAYLSLLEMATGGISSKRKKENEHLLRDMAEIDTTYKKLVGDLKLRDPQQKHTAFVLAALLHEGGPFTPWLLKRYKEFGFATLKDLLQQSWKLLELWMQ